MKNTTKKASVRKSSRHTVTVKPQRFAQEPGHHGSLSSLSSFNYTPMLMLLLVVAAFFLGVYVTKVQYLEQQKTAPQQQANAQVQGVTAAPAAPSITNDTIKAWAKEAGLDTNKFNSCLDSAKYKAQVDTDASDGRNAGVSGTPTFFINGTMLVGAQPFSAFKDIIDKELAGTASPTEKVTVGNGHLPLLGKVGSPVTIVAFSDFECPFCRRFYSDTYQQLKKEYVDTGKAVVYYRHFPLEFHPLATPFANASECANEQGKFWQMHDAIFEKQG